MKRHRRARAAFYSTGLILSAFAAAAAHAATGTSVRIEQAPAQIPKTNFGTSPSLSPKEPVVIEAEQIDYQQEGGLVIASGHVSVTQGETVLIADTLVYDQTGDIVLAQGHVSVLEPSGNVYFADEAELKSDMKEGVIHQFKARFSDNSVIVGAQAKKLDENRTELFKTAYSPCRCNDEETGEPILPQWRLRADRTLVDQETQEVAHDNVSFSVYGVPLLYSPYLSHAMPGADSKSGLLIPEYQHNENVGSMYKIPVYYAIAPDRDLTLSPIYTTQEGLVMASEYRQRFDTGLTLFDGSITRPSDRDAAGDPSAGHQFRGHINARGDFLVNPEDGWGFDFRRTTDDTYLRRYNFNYDTLLVSRAYADSVNFAGLGDRSYASIMGLSFQGLTAQDDQHLTPNVLPLGVFSYQTDPLAYHSRMTVDGNLLSLYRDTGNDTRRLSATVGWNLPYVTEGGQIIETRAQLRGDGYSVTEVRQPDGTNFEGETGRLIPQVSTLWRYPFVNHGEESSLLVEPVVMAAASPGGGNSAKIPNEDSVAPEFTDTNLFDPNRFPGYDRVENGVRISYGLRGQAQFFGNKYVDWLVGQNYRTDTGSSFPFSNDLDSHLSDYIGKVGLAYAPFGIAYRFRLDKDDLIPERQEVDFGYAQAPFTMTLSYLSLRDDPSLADKEVISGTAGINLTKEWSFVMSGNEDLQLNQITGAGAGLIFRNECTYISGIMNRTFTRDRDLRPSTNVLFRISLKNLD